MDNAIKKLPDSELEVMLVIWHSHTPLHTGEILQRLNPEKTRRIQSVQIFLGRLAEKGFVRCEKIGRLNYYTSLVDEDAYRARETASFIDKLYGASPSRLVTTLVRDGSLDEADLEELRLLLQKGGE